MYGKIRQRKLNQQDFILNCQVTRNQLESYIDDQARRVNQDSAKKRAVLQRMDYEGFRQMVLGANLFNLKTNQLIKFSAGETNNRNQAILNPVGTTFNNIKKKKENQYEQIVSRNQVALQSILKKQLKKQSCCNNFGQFKKLFNKFYQKQLTEEAIEQLYNLIKDQNEERLKKIFNSEFDATYFSRICHVFIQVIEKYVDEEKNIYQVCYMVRFLEIISQLKNIRVYVFNLLTKSQKQKVLQLIMLIQNAFQKLKNSSNQNLNYNLDKLKEFYSKI